MTQALYILTYALEAALLVRLFYIQEWSKYWAITIFTTALVLVDGLLRPLCLLHYCGSFFLTYWLSDIALSILLLGVVISSLLPARVWVTVIVNTATVAATILYKQFSHLNAPGDEFIYAFDGFLSLACALTATGLLFSYRKRLNILGRLFISGAGIQFSGPVIPLVFWIYSGRFASLHYLPIFTIAMLAMWLLSTFTGTRRTKWLSVC